MIVDTTAEELYKKVRHCEDQVKQKTVFSKDSLHMQVSFDNIPSLETIHSAKHYVKCCTSYYAHINFEQEYVIHIPVLVLDIHALRKPYNPHPGVDNCYFSTVLL